ncbi:MAG: SurA N-terminal domain-containing protein [Proteobacteria bacterium]|nr:SurA N-terminal domain-containing protein [Pseudomonadota bacterium]
MLDLMRKNAGSWIIKGLLGIIVVVFVFWGVGSFRAQRGNRVALVNGEVITGHEYQEAYNNLVEQVRAQFGKSLDENMLKTLDLKKKALDRLIERKIVVKEAEKLKFRITNDELTQAIVNIKAFQSDGVFNKKAYERALSQNRMTPEVFEASIKESMLIERIMSFVTGGVRISEKEALEWFKWKGASVNVNYADFNPERFTGINPTGEDLKAFFDRNKEAYKTEDKIKISYLIFEPGSYASKATVEEKDINEFYETNIDKFKRPKTVEARHILLKVEEGESPEVVEEKRVKAVNILKMIKEGRPFEDLAKEYSDCPSRSQGGYLGAFQKKDMVEPFAGTAFSLKPGEISEPVLTKFGWHIIKTEKVNEEKVFSLQETRGAILKKISEDKAKNFAYDEAEAVYNDALQMKDLTKAAEKYGLTIKSTDFFSRNEASRITGIDNPALITSEAFEMPEKEISDVKESGSGYAIIQVVGKMAAKTPELKDVNEVVKADLVKEKQNEKAEKEAGALLAALKNGGDMTRESARYGLSVSETGFFKRNENIPNIGQEPQITEAAFTLSKERLFPESVVRGTKGYYVIRFKEKKDPPAEGFDNEKDNIRKALLEQKKIKTFDAWLAQAKSRSKIEVDKEFLE